jgi:GTPase Era involved in 16S rRNA processing
VYAKGEAIGKPNAAELDTMRAVVRRAMEDGAFGIGSALIYPPGNYATTDELIEMAKAMSPYGGIYITHMRSEADQLLEGIDELLRLVGTMLPESPFLYPDDEISAQTVRFFVSELIRETALEQLEDEIPYSVACEIEEFRESPLPVYIRAVLHVERESQKRILIGAGGGRIRGIGRAARLKVEAFVGSPVYLDLWVKVLPNWRKSTHALRRFGYKLREDSPS